MLLPLEFNKRIDEIKYDYTNGSTVIAHNIISLLKDCLENIDNSELITISELARNLLSAKPHMAAPTNILKLFINEYHNFKTIKDAFRFIIQIENDMRKASEECINLTLSKLFKAENTTILTCSYSSTVFNTIIKAKKEIKVIIMKSIWSGVDYSEIWLDKLKENKIEGYVILQDDTIPQIDFAIIGADAILASGDVINGTPSLKLAEKMDKMQIPLFVSAESFKRCSDYLIIEGFELIPGKLISEVISDNFFDFSQLNL